jgi:hypothetical protein
MRPRIVLMCVLCFFAGASVWAQQRSEVRKFVIAPNDAYVLTVASQLECPIQIENAKLLLFAGPGSNWGASYRLRSAGTKPLRLKSITLSMWTSQGIGSSWQELTQDTERAVLPGELITIKEDEAKIEIVPLTPEVRDKLRLGGPLHAVVVLMVEQVKFSDGSVYSDERTSKALQSYFQNIDFVQYKAK